MYGFYIQFIFTSAAEGQTADLSQMLHKLDGRRREPQSHIYKLYWQRKGKLFELDTFHSDD